MVSLKLRLYKHGPIFNRLTVIRNTFWRNKNRGLYCKCLCICGNIVDVSVSNLLHGRTQSCKCLHREKAQQRSTTHGKARHPLYTTWCNINKRCYNSNHKQYKNYGGRGITVWDAWRNDPLEFISYIETVCGPRVKGMTLDRIENNGNYEPGNLKWSTHSEQNLNTRPALRAQRRIKQSILDLTELKIWCKPSWAYNCI